MGDAFFYYIQTKIKVASAFKFHDTIGETKKFVIVFKSDAAFFEGYYLIQHTDADATCIEILHFTSSAIVKQRRIMT